MLKDFNLGPAGQGPVPCRLKIRAAEEDCSQKEIVSTLLKDYLNGDPQSEKKTNE